jgi:hypothetical protein
LKTNKNDDDGAARGGPGGRGRARLRDRRRAAREEHRGDDRREAAGAPRIPRGARPSALDPVSSPVRRPPVARSGRWVES